MLQGAFKLDLFLLEGLNSDSIQSPYPKDIPAGTGCRMNVTMGPIPVLHLTVCW
jgi:hypothetical protein